MHPSGAHTHPEHGGGAGGAAVAVLALMIVAAFARPLLHMFHVLAELLRVLLIAAAALIGTGVAAGAGFVAWTLRHRRRPAPYSATVLSRAHPRRAEVMPPRGYVHRGELGGPAEVHLHLHGLTPEQAAEAIARHAQQATWAGQEGDRS